MFLPLFFYFFFDFRRSIFNLRLFDRFFGRRIVLSIQKLFELACEKDGLWVGDRRCRYRWILLWCMDLFILNLTMLLRFLLVKSTKIFRRYWWMMLGRRRFVKVHIINFFRRSFLDIDFGIFFSLIKLTFKLLSFGWRFRYLPDSWRITQINILSTCSFFIKANFTILGW